MISSCSSLAFIPSAPSPTLLQYTYSLKLLLLSIFYSFFPAYFLPNSYQISSSPFLSLSPSSFSYSYRLSYFILFSLILLHHFPSTILYPSDILPRIRKKHPEISIVEFTQRQGDTVFIPGTLLYCIPIYSSRCLMHYLSRRIPPFLPLLPFSPSLSFSDLSCSILPLAI
jgi:hypothetical protein